jgi:hypothetical protein
MRNLLFNSGGKERPETACERHDMLDLLTSTSADGTSMLSDETAALLVYIDYERKKQLASQGIVIGSCQFFSKATTFHFRQDS